MFTSGYLRPINEILSQLNMNQLYFSFILKISNYCLKIDKNIDTEILQNVFLSQVFFLMVLGKMTDSKAVFLVWNEAQKN